MAGFGGWVLGIDVGGTKIHMALAKDGRIVKETKMETKAGLGGVQCLNRIVEEGTRLVHEQKVKHLRAVGVGNPGVVNPRTYRTDFTWNIPGWDELPVHNRLAEGFGVPVAMENDANMASIAELAFGRHRSNTFAFIAIGTGIGGGIVLNGKLWRGKNGAAGEIARFVMNHSGLDPKFQDPGHLEYLVSGSGIEKQYKSWTGMQLSCQEIAELADFDNPIAAQILQTAKIKLAMAVSNLAAAYDLDTVILGGGVIVSIPDRWVPTIKAVSQHLCLYPPEIVISELGDRAGLLGAIAQAYFLVDGKEG